MYFVCKNVSNLCEYIFNNFNIIANIVKNRCMQKKPDTVHVYCILNWFCCLLWYDALCWKTIENMISELEKNYIQKRRMPARNSVLSVRYFTYRDRFISLSTQLKVSTDCKKNAKINLFTVFYIIYYATFWLTEKCLVTTRADGALFISVSYLND